MSNSTPLKDKDSPPAEQEQTKNAGLRLSEGILLAGVSSGAYLMAFYYEKGFASFFNIPVEFINVSLVNVLILTGLVISGLLVMFFFANGLIIFSPRNIHPLVLRQSFPLLLIAALTIIQIYMYGMAGWKYWLLYFVFLFTMVCITFVIPLISHRKRGNYIAKLEAQQQIDDSIQTLGDYAIKRFGSNAMLIFIVLIFSVSVSVNSGTAQALNQSEFMVVNTSPEMVVLRIYGDNIICAPFDRTTREVQRSFIVLKLTGDQKLSFNLEKVGPLRSVEVKVQPSATPTTAQMLTVNPLDIQSSTPSPVPMASSAMR